MPKVLNKRTDTIPSDAVYVGRPSKWGNPFKIGQDGTRQEVIAKYRCRIINILQSIDNHHLDELRGKDLVCWCHTWDGKGKNPMYCHADILLEFANR